MIYYGFDMEDLAERQFFISQTAREEQNLEFPQKTVISGYRNHYLLLRSKIGNFRSPNLPKK